MVTPRSGSRTVLHQGDALGLSVPVSPHVAGAVKVCDAHFGMMTQGPARSTLKVTAYVPLPLSDVGAFQEPAPAFVVGKGFIVWHTALCRSKR